MSDNVAPPIKRPSPKLPTEKTTAVAPLPTSASATATTTAGDQGSFQTVDPGVKRAQDKIQPPAVQTVVPESRAGRRTKEDLKSNLLMGQLSSRPAPRRKAKTGTLTPPKQAQPGQKPGKVKTRQWQRPLAEVDAVLTKKAEIIDQKRQVDGRTDDDKRESRQAANELYQAFPANVTCKLAQGEHLPNNSLGVCAALSVHWIERSLRNDAKNRGKADYQPYSFGPELEKNPQAMRAEFEDAVADQALADNGVSNKAALRAGLKPVERNTDQKHPTKTYGDVLFNGWKTMRAVRDARQDQLSSDQQRKVSLANVKEGEQAVAKNKQLLAQFERELRDLDSLACKLPPDEKESERKQLSSTVKQGKRAVRDAESYLQRYQELAADALKGSVAAQKKIDELSQQPLADWVAQVERTLEPDRTYYVMFKSEQSGHAVALRTGPALADPPAAGPRYASLDVMDPNHGEFHFDTATADGNKVCRDFLKKWGGDYLTRDYHGARYIEYHL